MTRRSLLVCGLFLLALLFRFWFALGYWSGKPLTHDANEYLELAENYNESGEFRYDSQEANSQIESYGRAPGYPYWLALLLRSGLSLRGIRGVEALVGLIQALLFFLIARELFGSNVGRVAFVVSLFYVPFIALAPVILSENVWLLLVLTSWYAILRGSHSTGPREVFVHLAFIILGLATLVRPAAVFLLPFYLFWSFRFGALRKALIGLALYALILLPWNLHLYLQQGRFIFVASEGGVTFWTGTHPLYSGDGDLAVNPAVQKDYRKMLSEHLDQTPAEREKLYFSEARRNIDSFPGIYLKNEGKKLVFWILPFGRSVMANSPAHRVVVFLFYIPLLILGLIGLRGSPRRARLFFAGLAISFTVMILLFFPQERFRVSTLDPVLLLFAARALQLLTGNWNSRQAAPV